MENIFEKKSIPVLINHLNRTTKCKYMLNIEIIGPVLIYITDDKIYSFSFIGAYSFPKMKILYFNQIPGIIFQHMAGDYTSIVKDNDLLVDHKDVNRAVKYFKSFFKKDDNLYLNYKRDLFWNTGNFNNVNILNDIRFVKNFILENKNILTFNNIKENLKLVDQNISFFKNDNRNIEIDLYWKDSPVNLGKEINFHFHMKNRREYKIDRREFNMKKLQNIFYDYFYEECDFIFQIRKFYVNNKHIFTDNEKLDEGYENRYNLFYYIGNLLEVVEKFKLSLHEGNKDAYKEYILNLTEDGMKEYIEKFFKKFILLKNEFSGAYEIILCSYFPIVYSTDVDLNGSLLIIYHRFTRIKIFIESILKYYWLQSGYDFLMSLKEEHLAILKKSEENKILFFSEEIQDYFKINHNITYVDQMWCTYKQYNITVVLFTSHLFLFFDRNNIEFKNGTLENFKIIDYNRLENTKMTDEGKTILIEIFSKNNNNNIYLNKQIAFENIIYRQYRFEKANTYSLHQKFYYFKGNRNIDFRQTVYENLIYNHYNCSTYKNEHVRLNSYNLLVDCNIKYLEEQIGESSANDLIVDRSILLICLNTKNRTLKYYSSKNIKLKPDIFTSFDEIHQLIYAKVIEHRYAFPLLQFDYIKYMNSLYFFNKSNEFQALDFKEEYFFGLGYLNNARKLMLFIEDEIVRFKVTDLYSDDISIRRYNRIISYKYEQRRNYKNYSMYDLTAAVNIYLRKSIFEIFLNCQEKNQYIFHFTRHFKQILEINSNVKIIHLLKLIDSSVKEGEEYEFLSKFN